MNVQPMNQNTVNEDITVSLANATVLVKYTATLWAANKRDKNAGDEVAHNHGVKNKRAARVYKSLLPDSTLHAGIVSMVGKLRRDIQDMTLPWSDGGDRILNVALLPQMMELVNTKQQEIDVAVEQLIQQYHNEVTRAAFTMGTLYDADDYPSVEEVRACYSFHFAVTPLPTTGDFRVDLPRDMAQQVRAAYQQTSDARVQQAMNEAWSRLFTKLEHLIDRLTSDDGGKRKKFSNGLLESAYELVDLLKHLNITNDSALEQARLSLRNILRGLTTEQVKNSASVRLEVVDELQAMQKKMALLTL